MARETGGIIHEILGNNAADTLAGSAFIVSR
jgi:hypothetical protein